MSFMFVPSLLIYESDPCGIVNIYFDDILYEL